MRVPLSVFIIAVDEGDRIVRTIESVRDWADEVIVIDSGSSDDTVQVSASVGARVIHNAWPGYGAQKRFGEEQCRNDWLLNLDADEVVSRELAEEIQALFNNSAPEHAGYTMHIMEILPGKTKPALFGHHVTAVRLYDRRAGRFRDSSVHDSVVMEQGTVGSLEAIVEHRSARDFTHSLAKIDRYSTMQAEDMVKRGKYPPLMTLRLTVEFPAAFIKGYVFRGYCLQGTHGFVNAMLYAFSRFARLAKAWEKRRGA